MKFRDHPRACGEKNSPIMRTWLRWGSPPRMRGKVACPASTAGAVGITPAHAGKSPALRCKSGWTRDHPRACGEKQGAQRRAEGQRGSPPRMRGKEMNEFKKSLDAGITPAHAGKRKGFEPYGQGTQDHPRACGEKAGGNRRSSLGVGITPAHAGKRYRHNSFQALRRDHPRACGEKENHSQKI